MSVGDWRAAKLIADDEEEEDDVLSSRLPSGFFLLVERRRRREKVVGQLVHHHHLDVIKFPSMGCVQSQSNGQAAKDKGTASVINDNNGQGGASAVQLDPRLPLNARQKYSMLASWKGISRALEPTGVYMFIKLFEEHKELLSLFTKFHKLTTRDEQASSEELAEHAVNVMTTLDESIRSLDNVDAFILYLHQIGQSHYKIAGFQKEFFWKIRNPFLEAVKMTLGDRYTDNIENIYKVSINLVIETLVEGYEKAHQQHLQTQPDVAGPSS